MSPSLRGAETFRQQSQLKAFRSNMGDIRTMRLTHGVTGKSAVVEGCCGKCRPLFSKWSISFCRRHPAMATFPPFFRVCFVIVVIMAERQVCYCDYPKRVCCFPVFNSSNFSFRIHGNNLLLSFSLNEFSCRKFGKKWKICVNPKNSMTHFDIYMPHAGMKDQKHPKK